MPQKYTDLVCVQPWGIPTMSPVNVFFGGSAAGPLEARRRRAIKTHSTSIARLQRAEWCALS